MYICSSISHITDTLDLGKDLLKVLFEKRKSLPFHYDYALDIIGENKLGILIEHEIIRRNGPYIEMDEHYLSLYELLLEANEEVFTSVIGENIQLVYQLIDYYGKEDNGLCKLGYLRSVKAHLRRIGKILVRSVVSLQRVIDNTLKDEPNYKVKIAKLENLDAKRTKINHLIVEMKRLLDRERAPFFTQAPNEELLTIARELKTELLSADHSLICSQQDIIDYLNQIRIRAGFTHKLRRIKYPREQFESQENTDVRGVVDAERSVVLEGMQPTLFKVSIPYLQTGKALDVILKVVNGIQPDKVIHRQELGVISTRQMGNQKVGEAAIDTRKMMDALSRTGGDLFSFMMAYDYNREMNFGAKVTLFCRLLSPYGNKLEITDHFGHAGHIEYAIVQRAQLQRRGTPRLYNWIKQDDNNNKDDR